MKKKRRTPIAPTGTLQPIRTLIVDDSAALLSGLHRFLDAQANIEVVGKAANGIEALDKADVLTPDLVLMDLQMPGMDGLQATALLRRRLPNTRIIIMTIDETLRARTAARAHGAHGFVGKSRIVSDLMTEIRLVFLLKQTHAEQPL